MLEWPFQSFRRNLRNSIHVARSFNQAPLNGPGKSWLIRLDRKTDADPERATMRRKIFALASSSKKGDLRKEQ